ncbi:MAG TPA: hypothetical protein VMD29_10880 [Terracidiphilus sp.]|nr:hypothetical protein [Terracidiphilus sp.]
MHRVTSLLIPLLLLASPAPELPKVFTSAKVAFPRIGEVSIKANVKQGSNPHLSFRSSRGGLLLDAVVGTGKGWKESVVELQPDWVMEKLAFVVIHRPGLPDPLVVALAMDPGGSDCAYRAALFGEVSGRLKELTPDLSDHDFRGGDVLSRRPDGAWALTVYSERYQANDVHVNGPSRMEVFVYRYDSTLGQFIKTSEKETEYGEIPESDPDLVWLFGDFAQC